MPPIDEPILQFFKWDHLPLHLQRVSSAFGQLAYEVVEKVPRNRQRTIALERLLEAKDAAVRAVLYVDAGKEETRRSASVVAELIDTVAELRRRVRALEEPARDA